MPIVENEGGPPATSHGLRSALLLKNGLPDLAASLIEAYRGKGSSWRVKFAYETVPPLSMDRNQAARMASQLREIGEVDLADEIEFAVGRAIYYAAV
jgi:hypothetical protein